MAVLVTAIHALRRDEQRHDVDARTKSAHDE